MPQKLRAAVRRQRRVSAVLWALVGVAWGAEFACDALNLPEHLVWDCRTASLALSIAALNTLIVGRLDEVNDRLDRAHKAMAELYREQPGAAVTPPPWPALRPVDGAAPRNGQQGPRASRKSSGA